MSNDVHLFKNKLLFKLHLLEKPYFYADDKISMSQPFNGSKKFILKDFIGDSLPSIAVAINKLHADGKEAFVMVGKDGCIEKSVTAKGITIKCLVL